MFNLVMTSGHSHNSDDIKTPGHVQVAVVDVVVDGSQQVVLLVVVDCLFGPSKIVVATCLHLNKDEATVLLSDDVDIAMSGTPVTLQNDIAFLT